MVSKVSTLAWKSMFIITDDKFKAAKSDASLCFTINKQTNKNKQKKHRIFFWQGNTPLCNLNRIL